MKTYGVDNNGYILKQVDIKKIKPRFKTALDEIKEEIVSRFEGKIFGLHLYGSVATGKAKEKSSDLDLLIVLKNKPTKKVTEKILELGELLTSNYAELFREVGIEVTYVKEVEDDLYGWGCCIKHLCICLWGEDIAKGLSKFKPSIKVAVGFNGDFKQQLVSTLKKLSLLSQPYKVKLLCSSAMRKILRTGFSVVMEAEKSWTTDLKKSCDTFLRYYPEQSRNIKTALRLAKTPTSNKKEIANFLNDFGNWMSKEVDEKLLSL